MMQAADLMDGAEYTLSLISDPPPPPGLYHTKTCVTHNAYRVE